MIIERDKDLRTLTTFGVPATAAYYARYSSLKELQEIMKSETFLNNEVMCLGGGSNLLFVGRYDGLVLHSAMLGRVIYRKDEDTVYAIGCGAENWADFVDWTVDQGLAGLENMAGIPGTVGASAVQNVGAYGAEAADIIHSVEVIDLQTGKQRLFTAEECRFGYRDSFFKHEGRNRYAVLRVSFRLKNTTLASRLNYGPLQALEKELGHAPSIREVRDRVVAMRTEKLPDPAITGSAGSFFKNPVVDAYYYREVIQPLVDATGESMPVYYLNEHQVKLSAGWVIDRAGLKGYRMGGAQVYQNNALVLTNTGDATSDEVLELSSLIKSTVKKKFAVDLEEEVNVIDTSMKVTVLGSGTSKGVPEIGCLCDVCRSQDPRDKRLRASVLVQTHGMNLLIDAGPDLRQQALQFGINRIDAVLLTHSHSDHVGGLDDLRPFCTHRHLPIYARPDVQNDLRRRLDYAFRAAPYPGVPSFELHEVKDVPFFIDGLKVTPVEVNHGKLPIVGYRIGGFAYITDASSIDSSEIKKLEGLDILIINALRHREHFAHFTVEQALKIIEEIKPKQAYLTHICHELGLHTCEEASLPPNIHLAYDGLQILL